MIGRISSIASTVTVFGTCLPKSDYKTSYHFIVVQREEQDSGGVNIRYMVETLRP